MAVSKMAESNAGNAKVKSAARMAFHLLQHDRAGAQLLSQALARLGSKVTQVEMADALLGREDADVSALAKAVLESDGVTVLTGHKAVRIEDRTLIAEQGGQEVRVPFDVLLVAVGRKARLTGFGLQLCQFILHAGEAGTARTAAQFQ